MAIGEGRVLIVANPAAQNGRGAKAAYHARTLLRNQLGRGAVDELQTSAPGDAVEMAAAAAGYHSVVALGGDGLVHEIVNGLAHIPQDSRPAFGVIPVGSGNDYARTLGMSEDVETAVHQLMGAEEHPADLGTCNGVCFAETLSFGLDAAVALETMELRKKTKRTGAALYLQSGIDQMVRNLKFYEYEAELDGARSLAGTMTLIAVQVGPTYGGGFRICPDAEIDDGLLDVCFASGPIHPAKAIVMFLSAKDAHHKRFKEISFDRATSLKLRFDGNPAVQIDGELMAADEYEIGILPRALTVLRATS